MAGGSRSKYNAEANMRVAVRRIQYQSMQSRLQYLQDHPYAGYIGLQGRFVICRYCVKAGTPIQPVHILSDIRRGFYDLMAWKRHCNNRHHKVHQRWDTGGLDIPKVPSFFSDEVMKSYGKRLEVALNERDLNAVRRRQRHEQLVAQAN
ncbi:hypothetical protein CVT24_008166 [Panaeolus cyanescens]|uniref:Uncharacterized protein n=1 Tax=Panaeolus cyanescens TaxID=181874 RepID=A0A409VFE5_9AGAR|nr:hypothetical protein CVT24_008166 [Panaeolus cyanescens]